MSIIKEVAFVAIAVSDVERARKFYQETLELKPSSTAMEGAWVEYDLGTVTMASAAIRRGNHHAMGPRWPSKWTISTPLTTS